MSSRLFSLSPQVKAGKGVEIFPREGASVCALEDDLRLPPAG